MKIPYLLLSLTLVVGLLEPISAFADSPSVIDDRGLKSKFQQGLEGLFNAKKATSLQNLTKQLTRSKAEVQLPEIRTKKLPPGRIYESCKPSVLMIGRLYNCGKCSNWHVSSASAFALTESGVIATNHHVVENNEGVALGAMDHTGKTYVVSEVLAANKADDVAILQLRDAKLTPLPLAAKAPVGTPINVISHPDGRYFTMTKGDVSRYFLARSKEGSAQRMAITADYAKGSSGAPVLNNSGAVVGMVSATNSIYYKQTRGHQENLQMVIKSCVPVDAIRKLLR